MKQREYIRSLSDHIAGPEGLLPVQLYRTASRVSAVLVRFRCGSTAVQYIGF